ncbi:MAG: DUF6188 family protein [Candidatus Limnocylindria bacterium]
MGFREINEIIGSHPSRICFDYAVALDLETEGGTALLRIEQTLQLIDGSKSVELVPEDRSAGLGILVGLLDLKITGAIADDTGALDLSLGTDIRLKVLPHSRSEAWTLEAPSGLLLVAAPTHGLVTWSPSRSDEEGPDLSH